MKGRMKVWAGIFLVSMLIVSGCGQGSGNSGNSGSTAGTPTGSETKAPDEVKKDPVKLTLWVPWTQEGPMEAFNKIMDAFNKQFEAEGISATVEFTPDFQQKLTTSLAGNVGPDLFIHGIGALAGFADVNQLEDIGDRVDQLTDVNDYDASYLKLASYNNNVYGLPVVADYNVLIYRKDFLQEAGVKVPTTWAEFEDAASKLVKKEGNKITRLAMDIPVGSGNRFILQQHYGFFLQNNGGDFLTGDYSESALGTEQAKEALKWFNSLYANQYVTVEGAGTPQGAQAVSAGTAAMQVGSLFQLTEIANNNPEIIDQIGVAMPPAGPGGDGETPVLFTGPQVVMMNKGSAHKDEAWKLIDFLAGNESLSILAEELGSIPLRASMGTERFEKTAVLEEYLKLGGQGEMRTNPLTPQWVAIRDVLVKYLEETVYKNNPEQSLEKAHAEINELLGK